MRKPKVYLETTMFNYYFDKERDAHADTVKLFEEIRADKYEAYTSAYVLDELEKTKDDNKRLNMLALIGEYNINVLDYSDEAKALADMYIKAGIIPPSKELDSIHIAISSINYMDYIFSFNFKHINRDKTKKMTSTVNLSEGYKPITIATPAEVIEYE